MSKKPSSVLKQLKKSGAGKLKQRTEPFWKGPCSDDPQGGITQSLLNEFLICPERFRIKTILGLTPPDQFNHALEYGHMWHLCEEYHAANKSYREKLDEYKDGLLQRYPYSQEEVLKFYNACLRQFPQYVKYWKKHKDEAKREPIAQEVSFRVPYLTGDTLTPVYLRGKWDQIDVISGKIWLKENKTKGQIKEQLIERQLTFDLQTMLYLVAIKNYKKELGVQGLKIGGVRYNVVRRPFSGGKGDIRQGKPSKSNPDGESTKDYFDRLEQYFIEEPEYWFMRWEVGISDQDIEKFEETFLRPALNNLVGWYYKIAECMSRDQSPFGNVPGHYRMPFGIYNSLSERGFTDMDSFLETGLEVGLTKGASLFPELEEG